MAQLRTVIRCAFPQSLQRIFAIVPVSLCLCMSGLLVRWCGVLHCGLHLIWKEVAWSVVGADRPIVFRLSLRFAGFGADCVGGGAGLIGIVVRGALVLLAKVGCLGGASLGGSS